MKITTIYTLALLNIFYLLSCSNAVNTNVTETNFVAPEALQEKSMEINLRSSYSGDLVNELFQELADKSPELKSLEAEMSDLKHQSSELNQKFNSYDRKSNQYYNSANQYASNITDSILKQKMVALINRSNNAYNNKIADIKTLTEQITKNGATIQDHYTILKIAITLPIIEKYQTELKPNKKEFKMLIDNQLHQIEKTNKLTPSY